MCLIFLSLSLSLSLSLHWFSFQSEIEKKKKKIKRQVRSYTRSSYCIATSYYHHQLLPCTLQYRNSGYSRKNSKRISFLLLRFESLCKSMVGGICIVKDNGNAPRIVLASQTVARSQRRRRRRRADRRWRRILLQLDDIAFLLFPSLFLHPNRISRRPSSPAVLYTHHILMLNVHISTQLNSLSLLLLLHFPSAVFHLIPILYQPTTSKKNRFQQSTQQQQQQQRQRNRRENSRNPISVASLHSVSLSLSHSLVYIP